MDDLLTRARNYPFKVDIIDELVAEIERLRAAITEIAVGDPEHAVKIANEALGLPTDEEPGISGDDLREMFRGVCYPKEGM